MPRLPLSGLSTISSDVLTHSHLASLLNSLTICSQHGGSLQSTSSRVSSLIFTRHASHASEGRANGPGDSDGRRLGAKKGHTEFVVPGNIIFKQRGTKWFPGENTIMGRDHTIHAAIKGYVRYYRDPLRHPKRRYIGVALEREGPLSMLPTPRNAPTRRRLGMYASPMKPATEPLAIQQSDPESGPLAPPPSSATTDPTTTDASSTEFNPFKTHQNSPELDATIDKFRSGIFRMSNYEIGLTQRPTNRPPIRPYLKKDRWYAWRKRTKMIKDKQLLQAAKKARKGKGKKSNKGMKLAGPGRKK